ncbi:hypothetical protein SSBG_05893 [Streptomyces sp. SPB074]|nr:hypothetical protein SSBG_05893 [Streptomyces sp. SPB074]
MVAAPRRARAARRRRPRPARTDRGRRTGGAQGPVADRGDGGRGSGAAGAVGVAGDQRTPGMSPRVKSRVSTPFAEDSAVKEGECAVVPFGSAGCSGAPGGPASAAGRDAKGGAPTSKQRSWVPHLLGRCHGRPQATGPGRTLPGAPAEPPPSPAPAVAPPSPAVPRRRHATAASPAALPGCAVPAG